MTDLHIYVPEELAAALKAQAQKNQRSITGEVRYISRNERRADSSHGRPAEAAVKQNAAAQVRGVCLPRLKRAGKLGGAADPEAAFGGEEVFGEALGRADPFGPARAVRERRHAFGIVVVRPATPDEAVIHSPGVADEE